MGKVKKAAIDVKRVVYIATHALLGSLSGATLGWLWMFFSDGSGLSIAVGIATCGLAMGLLGVRLADMPLHQQVSDEEFRRSLKADLEQARALQASQK